MREMFSKFPLCVSPYSRTRLKDISHTVILQKIKGKYFLYCLNCHKKAKEEFYE